MDEYAIRFDNRDKTADNVACPEKVSAVALVTLGPRQELHKI